MSRLAAEPTVRDRLRATPGLSWRSLRQVRRRDLLVRFLAGAATSVLAGVVTLIFGAAIGGTLLAFPAILAASLTLIEEEDDPEDAREDSRGAIVGGCALIAFAVVATVSLTSMAPAVALLLASATWGVVALGGYVLLWWAPPQRRRER